MIVAKLIAISLITSLLHHPEGELIEAHSKDKMNSDHISFKGNKYSDLILASDDYLMYVTKKYKSVVKVPSKAKPKPRYTLDDLVRDLHEDPAMYE